MPRRPRFDIPGTWHHAMVRANERRFIFQEGLEKDLFLDRLGSALKKYACRCLAWCMMDNHGHFLIQSGEFGLAPVFRSALTGFAVSYNHRYHRVGHLFQNRYHSVVCQEDHHLLTTLRYIHFNPIRAGIVKSFDQLDHHPWTSHAMVEGLEERSWLDTDSLLSLFSDTRRRALRIYRKFMMEGLQNPLDLFHDAKIPEGEFDPRIWGNAAFTEEIFSRSTQSMPLPVLASTENWTPQRLRRLVEVHFKLTEGSLKRKQRRPPASTARAAYAFLGAHYTPLNRNQLAAEIRISQPGFSQLYSKGLADPHCRALNPVTFLTKLSY